MTESASPLYTRAIRGFCGLAGVAMVGLMLSGCIYRINIQQGNLLDEEAVDQVEVGMSRSAVQFLLGTPTVTDSFHDGRWDYPYYFRPGRAKESEAERRWVVVYFENDLVSRIERNVILDPSS